LGKGREGQTVKYEQLPELSMHVYGQQALLSDHYHAPEFTGPSSRHWSISAGAGVLRVCMGQARCRREWGKLINVPF